MVRNSRYKQGKLRPVCFIEAIASINCSRCSLQRKSKPISYLRPEDTPGCRDSNQPHQRKTFADRTQKIVSDTCDGFVFEQNTNITGQLRMGISLIASSAKEGLLNTSIFS